MTKNKKFIYYKLEEKENSKEIINNQSLIVNNINNIDNNDDIIDIKFIKDIFFILSSIFIFEKNIIKNSIQKSYKSDCFLLSNQFLIDFKKLFSYDKVYSILEKLNLSSNDDFEGNFKKFSDDIENENMLRLIFNNEKEFEKNKDKNKEYFIYEKKVLITDSQKSFLYPDKFCILDENIYSKINELLNINIESIEEIKFELSFNYGKIALNPKSFTRFNNQYYILICPIIKNESMKQINYNPEIILSFDTIEKMNNSFEKIIKSENIFKACSEKNIKFENKYNCKSYLINKIIELNKNIYKENKYLPYVIIINNEYSKIKKEINEKAFIKSNTPEKEDKEYYLINREYMIKLEKILNLNEFINEINIGIDEITNLDLDINNINNDIIDKIKGRLSQKITNYLIKIDEKKLIIDNDNDNENEISETELFDNKNNKLYFYNNCQIINKKLFLLLEQFDKNLSTKIKHIRCVLGNKKIILFSNDNIINIGFLNEDNTFIIEHIIYSDSSENIPKIFEILNNKGYTFIQKYLSFKKFKININNKSLEVKIYSLLGENEANKNRKELSPKLKSLILLSLLNQNKENNYKDNKTENVFLMNKDWLFQYKYEEIYSLIEKNEKLRNYLNEKTILNLSIDSIQMNNIINLLDYDSLIAIDAYISKISKDSVIPHQAKTEILKLKNKEIAIYTNFVMIKEEISKIFEKNFSLSSGEYNDYTPNRDGDIIVISKFFQQHSILFGNINNNEYSFNIKYIFEFEHRNILKNELKYLINNGINEYIKNKTLFNDKNESDIISPIFDDDNEIGNCYKYYSNKQYLNYNNFYDYKNSYLLKAIELYFYYHKFSRKIMEAKSDEKEYFLININFMSEIKDNYKYKEIKEILDTINFKDINNKKILAIKSLSNDIIKYFKENNDTKGNYEKDFIEPDLFPIKYLKNEEKIYMIYDKFEILEREKALNLFDGIYRVYGIYGLFTIYGSENNYLKCVINEGKIIIHYPQDFFCNDKCISVIGQLDNENLFLNEYILIYNDSSSRSDHMSSIKGDLNKYIKSLQLYQNSAPITDKNYKEIGAVIKYDNETSNYNSSIIKNKIKEIKDNIKNNSNKVNSNNEIINEAEYNLDYQTDSPDIIINFPFPPKIGLQNIGATCYMNATLQCFCHIEKFVNYFKYSHQVVFMVRNNKNNLISSFKLLIEKLWPNNYNESYTQKYYAPEEFKNKISKMNPLFEGIAANDAKDLVNFIIMTLHQELNKGKKNNNNNDSIILDQRNQQIMFNNFAQNFELENQSIISDLFYGINCNITQCSNCNTNIYNYQVYFFLVFPLEEVRKFKNDFFSNNQVNIYDCFDYDKKVNFMYGENSMFCNYCRQNTNCKMCTCLTIGPEILILLLNRGQGIEFNVKINFMEDLDLTNYIQYKNTGVKYKLIGVITHIGESGMGGHFIAYCKDPISKSWNKYNDAIVSDVQEQDFQKEVINFAMPYLLFYQKSS